MPSVIQTTIGWIAKSRKVVDSNREIGNNVFGLWAAFFKVFYLRCAFGKRENDRTSTWWASLVPTQLRRCIFVLCARPFFSGHSCGLLPSTAGPVVTSSLFPLTVSVSGQASVVSGHSCAPTNIFFSATVRTTASTDHGPSPSTRPTTTPTSIISCALTYNQTPLAPGMTQPAGCGVAFVL